MKITNLESTNKNIDIKLSISNNMIILQILKDNGLKVQGKNGILNKSILWDWENRTKDIFSSLRLWQWRLDRRERRGCRYWYRRSWGCQNYKIGVQEIAKKHVN